MQESFCWVKEEKDREEEQDKEEEEEDEVDVEGRIGQKQKRYIIHANTPVIPKTLNIN